MFSFAISRIDQDAKGIEIVWTWPDVLPLSVGGYDIYRLENRESRKSQRCETINSEILNYLRGRYEFDAALGPLRYRGLTKITQLGDIAGKLLNSAKNAAENYRETFNSFPHVAGDVGMATHMATAAMVASPVVEVFVQELTQASDFITVNATASVTVAMAFAKGKCLCWGYSASGGGLITLSAPQIDMVYLYAVSLREFTLCARYPVPDDQKQWSGAKLIAKGLTLPIVETDPALVTLADEFGKAKSRLLGLEVLDVNRFQKLCEALRRPSDAVDLGRNGARLSRNRIDTTQSFEEMSFEQQLSALLLHPKLRRVLGFGHFDDAGLTLGATYQYRVVAHCESQDVEDRIYDVHRVASSTTLPDMFWIRDMGFRFQVPVKVVVDPPAPLGILHASGRRGILIDTKGHDGSWLLPDYESWSAIITLPEPVVAVTLEVGKDHNFSYAAGVPWLFGSPTPQPLPSGPFAELQFATPVQEIRLSGTGILFTVRVPSGNKGKKDVFGDSQPVQFVDSPPPLPPIVLVATNLQSPASIISGPLNETTIVPPREPIGFRLTWLPAISGGLPFWPDDQDAGPPLDSVAFMIDHRVIAAPSTPSPWEPVNADDNLTLGSRDMAKPTTRLERGCDIETLFPANRPRTGSETTLSFSDIFGEKDPTTGILRPSQPLGSLHQYRIRAVDVTGRMSATETLSNVVRLEKHQPPPLPTGPQPAPDFDANGHLTRPAGPRARAIVKGARGLSPADLLILGDNDNAIVLQWGWRQAERDLDPTTTEFRIYQTSPPDVVSAEILSATSAAPFWTIAMSTNQPLVANELICQWIEAGGYPYIVTQNSAGLTPVIELEASKLNPTLQPALGPVTFGRPLRAEHQNPSHWAERVAVVPLTAADTYQYIFYNMLTLNVGHPRDVIWVGVSAADSQFYVPDQRTAGALANRPGNESAIATTTIAERYRGQPVFSMPPPLADVPEHVTEEPTGRQILVSLDLSALLAGGLPDGAPVALHRCSVDAVLSRLSVSGTNVILSVPGQPAQVVAFPNSSDHAEVLGALNGTAPQRIATKYLMHALITSTHHESFFERPNADIVNVGVVKDRLPPKAGRFFYQVKLADALGHISEGGAILPIAVRVPSVAGAALPMRRSLKGEAGKITLKAAVANDPDTTHLILFSAVSPPNTMPAAHPDAQILRVPNRRDLYPSDGIRLRLKDGTLLSPSLTKDLSDNDVTVEADGTRVAVLENPAVPGSFATLWCFAVTRDGQLSRMLGPLGQGVKP